MNFTLVIKQKTYPVTGLRQLTSLVNRFVQERDDIANQLFGSGKPFLQLIHTSVDKQALIALFPAYEEAIDTAQADQKYNYMRSLERREKNITESLGAAHCLYRAEAPEPESQQNPFMELDAVSSGDESESISMQR